MNGLEMKYFVLKPSGITEYHLASRVAMLAYAEEIADTNQELADDLTAWALKEEKAAEDALDARKGL